MNIEESTVSPIRAYLLSIILTFGKKWLIDSTKTIDCERAKVDQQF